MFIHLKDESKFEEILLTAKILINKKVVLVIFSSDIFFDWTKVDYEIAFAILTRLEVTYAGNKKYNIVIFLKILTYKWEFNSPF